MLRYILFDTTLFAPGDNQEQARKNLGWVLEALTQLDQQYLRDHPDTPPLYKSGVKYERPAQFGGDTTEVQVLRQALGAQAHEPKIAGILDLVQQVLGGERFRDIGRIIENGGGDCDNVSTWRSAELRQSGIKASPYLMWRKRLDGGYTYHIVVRWPDNTIEDPSLLLGMGGEGRRADRDEEIRKNAERVQMAKDAAARGPGAKAPASANDEMEAALSDVLGRGARRRDEVLGHGHGGGHGGHHGGNFNFGGNWVGPGDDWDLPDLDFNDDFDSRVIAHTGLMRGR